MAYYIAAINIEATLHGILEDQAREAGAETGTVEYVPFDGIVLTDTFQMTEDGDTLDEHVFTSNNERAVAQNKLDIRVIIGNPPYSVGQGSGNDNNANLKYRTLDESIRTTYVARSTATNKNSLYDSYIRAIRWASNRILNSDNGGVVCYVSNGGYIDGNTADGLRKTLTNEFHEIYVYNLRGNQRTAGEQSRREGGKVFDSGSRNTVAVLLLVKRPGPVEECRLSYRDIGDYLDRKEKLAIVDQATLGNTEWQQITPNNEGDWVNQRNEAFESFIPLSAKDGKNSIFASNGAGLQTNRDAWVYNYSDEQLKLNVRRMIGNYNQEVDRWKAAGSPAPVEQFITADAKRISWARSLRNALSKGRKLEHESDGYRTGTYRPFSKQRVYFAPLMNHERGQQPKYFPRAAAENFGFYLNGVHATSEFAVLAMDEIPCLDVFGKGGQFFPRYIYTTVTCGDDLLSGLDPNLGTNRTDNITDSAHEEFRTSYGPNVSKDDIFYYTYALLHSPEYRERFGADLKKMLPRIPKLSGGDRFRAFVDAGRSLADLHLGYEDVDAYPLTEIATGLQDEADEYGKYKVTKMRYGGKSGAWDKTIIKYNDHVTIEGIPEEAQRYMLGSRSALDWILERYQLKTDKASGIVNDPNDWARENGQPRYIIDLVGRIVTVSCETMRIVDRLPELRLETD
ncbi:type ISP restriction/modification enzyme [Arthrobacter sp.]|uniref:type ISP restriction/modification enzyme n=1 Tax=Arthrobacter sp. TaxID=1667 RepID=UPI003A94B854